MGLVEVGKVGMTEEGNGLYNFDQLGDGEMESVLRRKRGKRKKRAVSGTRLKNGVCVCLSSGPKWWLLAEPAADQISE